MKQNPDGEKYGYITKVIIHPEFQKKGIATELLQKAEVNLKDKGASHVHCYIFEPNETSKILFSKLGYSNVGDLQAHAISIYKKAKLASEFVVRNAGKEDIPAVLNLINKYYAGCAHFVPSTPETFETHVQNISGYGLDNFWVALKDNKIVACAGLWNPSGMVKFYYAKEPSSIKLMGNLFSFLSLFTRMPKIPAENECCNTCYLTDYAFTPENLDIMLNLVKNLNNLLVDTACINIIAPLDPDD